MVDSMKEYRELEERLSKTSAWAAQSATPGSKKAAGDSARPSCDSLLGASSGQGIRGYRTK